MANIDISKLGKLVKKADEIFLTPAGEQVLLDLLTIQTQVEEAIKEAKAKLEETALKTYPNFSSIRANRIKVYYREYGTKYYIDEAHINQAPKEFYEIESKVSYRVKTKELEEAINKTGKVPAGIIEVERKKTLTFSEKTKKAI